jgi:hypothetical protein
MAKVNPILPILTEQDIKRFWGYVDKSEGLGPQGKCWEWTNLKNRDGYGIFNIFFKRKGRPLRAHRVSYLIANGEWPTLLICHQCDNRICVHPEHLFKGTNMDNQQDAKQKGRLITGDAHHMKRAEIREKYKGDNNPMRKYPDKVLRGDKNGNSRYTAEMAHRIRVLHRSGLSMKSIARNLQITFSTVQRIAKYHTWRHLTSLPPS